MLVFVNQPLIASTHEPAKATDPSAMAHGEVNKLIQFEILNELTLAIENRAQRILKDRSAWQKFSQPARAAHRESELLAKSIGQSPILGSSNSLSPLLSSSTLNDDAILPVSDTPSANANDSNGETTSPLETQHLDASATEQTPLIFDIPVTYNSRVRHWIHYFQRQGRSTFKTWLERSARYMPFMQDELARARLPQDLVYVVMVESGFQPRAQSEKGAVGLWQFMAPTARQYGLRVDWWLDERRDFYKSTRAAIAYLTDLNRQFNSWYLVAASYNMGENGVQRLLNRHRTNNFWTLAERGALPIETRDYVPKIIAAMLISKAPGLYGFRDLNYHMPLSFEYIRVPGGTDIINLASYLGVSEKYLRDINPELVKGFVPRSETMHRIRIPKGAALNVAQYIRLQSSDAGATTLNHVDFANLPPSKTF